MGILGWNGISREFVNCNALQELFFEGHYLVNSPWQLALEDSVSHWTGVEASAVTNCGMAAIEAVVNFLIQPGDCVLFSKALYPGTIQLAGNLGKKMDVEVQFVDSTNFASLQEMVEQLRPRFYFFEMIGNSPRMPVVNYKATLDILAGTDTFAVIDTTLIPSFHSCLQENWGVKVIEVGSLSKWESGGKVTGGRISGTAETIQRIKSSDYYRQVVMQPVVAREISLHRMITKFPEFCENAITAAQMLANYPDKVEVFYPGLGSHPDYHLAHSQFEHLAGGIFYAVIKGGKEAAIQLADGLNTYIYWSIAPSFGTKDWRILPLGLLKPEEYDPGLIRIAAGLNKSGLEVLQGVLSGL